MLKPLTQLPPKAVLAGTFLVFLGPFLAVMLFPAQLDLVIEKSIYLVFHNLKSTEIYRKSTGDVVIYLSIDSASLYGKFHPCHV